jgi:hypothetical protein
MSSDNSKGGGGGGGGGDGYQTLFCMPKSQYKNLLDRAEGSGGSGGGGGGNGEQNIHINVADGQGNHESSCGSADEKKKKDNCNSLQ